MKLRDYQQTGKTDISSAWSRGARNVLYVLATGGGKTVLFSEIVRCNSGGACVIAHRQELVTQISLALARNNVRHKIIGPIAVIKQIVAAHISELKQSFYDINSNVAVAGVDTLVRRTDSLRAWANRVTLWVQDEAHHLLRENKWGKAVAMFPNAKGLGVTATPVRADGHAIGRTADGVFDEMVLGPDMRALIDKKYLSEYRIFAPPSNLDLTPVKISKTTGDYSPVGLKSAIRKSKIVGDIVEHYLRIARNKLGVTFATDVQTATDIAEQFNTKGVPAAIVSAKTPGPERADILSKFKNRELMQLVNVDLFSEGFDLPAIEAVSMGRPTKSYALYAQQFGRALRIMPGKKRAIIIDHVGNVGTHGLPDSYRSWTIHTRQKRVKLNEPVTPVRTCAACTGVYERVLIQCPYCDFKPTPAKRSSPEIVEGDLTELTAETLKDLRARIDKVDMNPEHYRLELAAKHAPLVGQLAGVNRHVKRQEAQAALRDSIAIWAGYQRALNRCDQESYRRFYQKFKIDVMTAQTLNQKKALQLRQKIQTDTDGLEIDFRKMGKKMGADK
jgi:superfamily II DNA or RNA helicase